MDFYTILEQVDEGQAYSPYAGKSDDEWIEGTVSIDFLNEHFGKIETATEMKEATTSEGLKLFFDWLVEQEKIPA